MKIKKIFCVLFFLGISNLIAMENDHFETDHSEQLATIIVTANGCLNLAYQLYSKDYSTKSSAVTLGLLCAGIYGTFESFNFLKAKKENNTFLVTQ